MADERQVNDVLVYRDSAGFYRERPIDGGTGNSTSPSATMVEDRDTDGNPVPTYKAHTYTYYGAGQVETDTVTDGTHTWVRTYGYMNGQQTTDSGWVKQ